MAGVFQLEIDDTTHSLHNEWMDTWGVIAAACIGLGDLRYKLNAIYVEYENLSNPANTVVVPTIDCTIGVRYYNQLNLVANRDYLRLPIVRRPQYFLANGTHVAVDIPEGMGNGVVLTVDTTGVAGIHGRPFGVGNNSKIIGLAAAATPVWADPTSDIVFSRAYWTGASQVLLTSATWSLSYQLAFPRAGAV